MTTVAIDQLRDALTARAAELGFARPRAERLADHFLDAEMRGARGHGAERMRWLHGLGDLRPHAVPLMRERSDGLARYDGDGALGYLALAEVLADELADPPQGARLIAVADCFPTGRLGYYAELGADAGLLTLVTATSTPRIVHPDGGPPLLGTNPLCLGLPGRPPTVIDVSMGAVTYGAVLKTAATGGELDARRCPAPGRHRHPRSRRRDRQPRRHRPVRRRSVVQGLRAGAAGRDALRRPGRSRGPLGSRAARPPRGRPDAAACSRGWKAVTCPERAASGGCVHPRAAGTVDLPDDLWAWLQPDG